MGLVDSIANAHDRADAKTAAIRETLALDGTGSRGLALTDEQSRDITVKNVSAIDWGLKADVQVKEGAKLLFSEGIRILNPPIMVPTAKTITIAGPGGNPVVLTVFEERPLDAYAQAMKEAVAAYIARHKPTTKAPMVYGSRDGSIHGDTTIIYGLTADGHIASNASTYASARAGTGSLSLDYYGTSILYAGQWSSGGDYDCYESFVGWDTSGLPDADTISAAVIDLYLDDDGTTTDFTTQVRSRDWSAGGLTTADFVAGASLSALTLLATNATYGADGYKTFASEAGITSWVNKTGSCYAIVVSDRMVAGTSPSGNEYAGYNSADYTGTTRDPKLTITHAAAGGSKVPAIMHHLRQQGIS